MGRRSEGEDYSGNWENGVGMEGYEKRKRKGEVEESRGIREGLKVNDKGRGGADKMTKSRVDDMYPLSG